MAEQNAQDMKSVIAFYLDGPRLLEEAVAGVSEADLDAAPDAENWSIRQLVHHMVDGDDVWSMAVKMALGGAPVFPLDWYLRVPQLDWSRKWAYARREIQPALALLAANRQYMVDLVDCVQGAWDCAVLVPWQHQEASRLSVGEILAMQGRHIRFHIEDIQKIRQMHGL